MENSESRTSQGSFRRLTVPGDGFTLIELLVAAALVVLMMTIFAEVFQMASGSMTLQRTIAENDQQVRTFTTLIRGDLQKRTFRSVIPYFPREDFNLRGVPFGNRHGYFYVSSNDANRGDDTVLQFTSDANITIDTSDVTPYYGRAEVLGPQNQFLGNPNQPETDDGQIEANGTTSSSAAEICYFVRNGVLYRRVVLLRQPLQVHSSKPIETDLVQPATASGVEYFTSATGINYWNVFDVAAFRDPSSNKPKILGMDWTGGVLDNQRFDANATPLGRSRYRFGFDNSYALGSPTTWAPTAGLSREFFGATNDLFLGRFTHEETSSPNFSYPFANPGANPFATTAILNDANSNGIADSFEGGARAGQDILLTHVHSFEVEFFDERLGDFAPVGHLRTNSAGESGDFHDARCLNRAYNPLGLPNARGTTFDTWHPWYDRDGQGVGDAQVSNYASSMQQDLPPYRPMTWDPMGVSAPARFNPNGRPAVWQPTVDYQVGDIVFPPTEDSNYDGVLDSDGQFGYQNDSLIDAPGGEVLVPAQPYGRVYYYICRRPRLDPNDPAQIPSSYANQPLWGSSPGVVFGHRDTSNPNTPKMAQWEAVLNLRSVRAVRMTVRFLHRGSNKLRQLTLIHSIRK